MRATAIIVLAAFWWGCASHERPTARLEDYRFEVPDGWKHEETRDASRVVSMWTPETNDAKESISVIRTSLRGDLKHPDAKALITALETAQRSLPAAEFQAAMPLRTPKGLQAFVMNGSFVPAGQSQRYQRVHALVFDGKGVIHVLYTARAADPSLQTFHLVLDTLRREEG